MIVGKTEEEEKNENYEQISMMKFGNYSERDIGNSIREPKASISKRYTKTEYKNMLIKETSQE